METVTIESRAEFSQWAIERARAIVAEQGGDLALAVRDMDEDAIARTGGALGQAITDALMEVFDGLLADE